MGKRIWALLALGLALIIMVPVMGHADQHHRRGHDDAVITITERDGGHRVIVRGGDDTWEFDEDDWEDLEEMLADVGVNIDETVERALESLEDVDLDLGRHRRQYARLHGDLDLEGLEGLEGLEELGEKLGRMGERLAEQFEHQFDDHEGRWERHGERWEAHGERWEDFGERLAERIERQIERDFGRDFERDVRRQVERDVARGFRGHDIHVDIDDHLDSSDVRRTERDIRKQMRRLQKELRRLERELERLEDID